MRSELRIEIESLRTKSAELEKEQQRLEKELDEWKQKYYTELQDHMKTATELQITVSKLREILPDRIKTDEPTT